MMDRRLRRRIGVGVCRLGHRAHHRADVDDRRRSFGRRPGRAHTPEPTGGRRQRKRKPRGQEGPGQRDRSFGQQGQQIDGLASTKNVHARALAFLHGRGHVIPDDVKTIAPDVLRHRIILTYEAEAEEKTSEDIIAALLDHVEVP